MHEIIILFTRYMIIMMNRINTTWIIVKYVKCLAYFSWYNYAYIFLKHCNFVNVSTRIIIKAKLFICFYFDVSRMLKLCHLLICPYPFHLHDLNYGGYSIYDQTTHVWLCKIDICGNFYNICMYDVFLFIQYWLLIRGIPFLPSH